MSLLQVTLTYGQCKSLHRLCLACSQMKGRKPVSTRCHCCPAQTAIAQTCSQASARWHAPARGTPGACWLESVSLEPMHFDEILLDYLVLHECTRSVPAAHWSGWCCLNASNSQTSLQGTCGAAMWMQATRSRIRVVQVVNKVRTFVKKSAIFLRWSPCTWMTWPSSSSSTTVPLQQYSFFRAFKIFL